MGLLNNKLSALQPGSHVQITNLLGQVMDGIVAENDGKESISIQVTTLATLRYDQIGMIQEGVQPASIQQVLLPDNSSNQISESDKDTVVVTRIFCDKDSISKAYKAMKADEKRAFAPAYSKFQSYLKSHEEPKYDEAVNLIWNIIEEKKWGYNSRVNLFLAYVQLSHDEYKDAAESFFFGGNAQYAYCCAYQGTEHGGSLYQLAAAFSAIYLTSESPSEFVEAVGVLRKASLLSKDISGIEYALNNTSSSEIREALLDALRKIGKDYVKDRSEIENKIKDYLSKVSDEAAEDANDAQLAEPEKTDGEIDLTKTYKGQIVTYNYFEGKGTIKSEDGKEYPFELKDITDTSFQEQVKKISSKNFSPIKVKFSLKKFVNKYVVASVKRGAAPASSVFSAQKYVDLEDASLETANYLFANRDYAGALEICKQHMKDSDWEVFFAQSILCYLALSNEHGELGYLDDLRVFVEKYVGQTTKNARTLEALLQYYMKTNDYEGALRALNDLIDICDPSKYNKTLHYIEQRIICYKAMKNYRSAISELMNWLDIVKRNKMEDRYAQRKTRIYIELAELYYELEDYKNSEKYVNMSGESDRKTAMMEKLAAQKTEPISDETLDKDDKSYEEEDDTDEEVSSELEESLQMAYEAYKKDSVGFDALDTDDTTVISKAFGFDEKHLYCLLTYLDCAAMLSDGASRTRVDENGTTVDVGRAIKSVNLAVSYAFNSPLMELEYLSTEIEGTYEEAKRYIADEAPAMFAASALYALFQTPSISDYNIDDFPMIVEAYDLKQYPALMPLIKDLVSFRERTGYGMDAFADYKTSAAVLEAIIEEAKACCEFVDMKNVVREDQGQVRKLRELMFSGDDSALRICLNIVASNETDRYQYVKNTITDLFIRSGKNVSADNLDSKKLDKYIDGFWNQAKNALQDDNKHIGRPHDKIKGKRRNNVVMTIRRILSCVCDWLSVAEHAIGNDNRHAVIQYENLAPKVRDELSKLISACEGLTENRGFDWGTESIRRACAELLAKMNGTYSNKDRRYFFIDFLKGEDILLNDAYLPETQSTFCDMPEFNILARIERHASKNHLELQDRLAEILSNDEFKHNFRTARLIRAYGEDKGITEITEHKDLAQYEECLRQAKQRFETKCQDFSDELELCKSYGMISDINGEKDTLLNIASDWFRITKLTGDYGFYVRLLGEMRNRISVNAAKKGEQLMRQLEDLSSNPNYNFGVFDKEAIEAKINDQNYSSAEYIMSRILCGDVNAISNYSDEPLGYFEEFISEYGINSRAVRDAGRNIKDVILAYSHKKTLETALAYETNNAHKETRGGANLLENWIPNGGKKHQNGPRIKKLLTSLKFKVESVEPDDMFDEDVYNVFCRKQIGKVNYVHHIPAFGSKSETEGFRVLCLYGNFTCDTLMDKFRTVNATSKHTLVLLDFAMNLEERRRLARKIKEEKTFAKTFIVLDRVVLFYLAKHYAENTVIRRLMAVTLPFAYYQPFVEASSQDMPPELFTGREAELTSIESPEGANLVYGGRQLGKSVLLKMAKRNIDRNGNGDRAVLIDIKDLTASEALKVICDKLVIEEILDNSCECSTWSELAGQLQRRLMDDNPETRIHYLLLMLDEADKFIGTSSETDDQPITALKSLPSDRFKLVMAGLHNLSRYNRRSMHGNSNLIHLTPITIRQFRREEATKLLTSILAYLGFELTQEIIDNILASTYNYPGLIQLYCQKLLEAMKNDDYAGYAESNTPTYKVTESHYKKVLSDTTFTDIVAQKFEATLFTEEEGRSNYHIIALILAYLYYTEPNKNEKGYTYEELMGVAEEYHINRVTSLKSEQLSEILSEMLDLNVIKKMDGNYCFTTDGFRKLLGSQEKVEKSLSEYFEEDIAV